MRRIKGRIVLKVLVGMAILTLGLVTYGGLLFLAAQKDDACALEEAALRAGGWTNHLDLFPPAMECRYSNGEVVRIGPLS